MKESRVCKRFRDFCIHNFNDKTPFPITVNRFVSYIKYRGRSLSTFQDHLIGLEKHEKHGPEWIRQVRNDPKILKLVDQFDNRIKANNHRHKTLRSRWSAEMQSDKLEAIKSNGLIYGQNGAVCTEVKGPKNKGFRVTIPQERPTPFVSSQSSIAQTPSLSSSSSSSPPQLHQQHSQMLNNSNSNSNINMPDPIDIDDYSDVLYDDNFDQEYQLEQQQVLNHLQSQQQCQPPPQQRQLDSYSDIPFGDDEEFEKAIANQINTATDNRRVYSILDSYDFDNVEAISDEQTDAPYADFDLDIHMDHQDIQNHGNDENAINNNNSNSDDDDDGVDNFDTYVHRISYSDQGNTSDTYSDYAPSIYIAQRYLRPKSKVQVVQQVLDSEQTEPAFYSQSQPDSLSVDGHYEPVVLIKANKKRKACFLFEDEVESRQVHSIESSDQSDFIDDSMEGEIDVFHEEDEQESSKGRQKNKGVFVSKDKNKIRIQHEVIDLVDSDTDQEDQDNEDKNVGATADMLNRLKKSNLFDLYKKRMSRYK